MDEGGKDGTCNGGGGGRGREGGKDGRRSKEIKSRTFTRGEEKKTIIFYMVLRTWTFPRFHTCFTLTFKIIDISLEVSKKSTFPELLKTAHVHSSQRSISIASIWALKKPSKTLIILHISLKRPPEGFI